MSLLGVVAGGAGERLEAVHVAVVVGAEQVDLVREAAVALVQVVGGIGGEVGVLAVAAADDAVLVVAEVGRAHPDGAVLVEDVALRAQPVDRLSTRLGPFAGSVACSSALREPHVEVHVERSSEAWSSPSCRSYASLARGRERVVVGQLEQVGLALEHAAGELVDVLAGVAVLGRRLALRRGEHRAAEASIWVPASLM